MELRLRQLPPPARRQPSRLLPARKPRSHSRPTPKSGSSSAPRPDLRTQILATPELAPTIRRRVTRRSRASFLPSADVDSIMGLLHLREFQSFFVFATAALQTHPEKRKQNLRRSRSLRSSRPVANSLQQRPPRLSFVGKSRRSTLVRLRHDPARRLLSRTTSATNFAARSPRGEPPSASVSSTRKEHFRRSFPLRPQSGMDQSTQPRATSRSSTAPSGPTTN